MGNKKIEHTFEAHQKGIDALIDWSATINWKALEDPDTLAAAADIFAESDRRRLAELERASRPRIGGDDMGGI